MAKGKPRIAFIGFGEAGQAIAAGLHDAGAARMTAWDILFPAKRDGRQTAARRGCERRALCRFRRGRGARGRAYRFRGDRGIER